MEKQVFCVSHCGGHLGESNVHEGKKLAVLESMIPELRQDDEEDADKKKPATNQQESALASMIAINKTKANGKKKNKKKVVSNQQGESALENMIKINGHHG